MAFFDSSACTESAKHPIRLAVLRAAYPPREAPVAGHGHYMDIDGGGGLQMAPPRSVVGQMAVVACVGGQND
jgi:hypothetical protein